MAISVSIKSARSVALSLYLSLYLWPSLSHTLSATVRTSVSLEEQRRNILRVRILEAPQSERETLSLFSTFSIQHLTSFVIRRETLQSSLTFQREGSWSNTPSTGRDAFWRIRLNGRTFSLKLDRSRIMQIQRRGRGTHCNFQVS